MLTLFSTPKPFKDHINTIQRNAIKSWTLLRPKPEIILFGNDEGVSNIAKEYNLRHVSNVQCNEYGTPLVNDIFNKAQSISSDDILCYVNADIILMSDFMVAVRRVMQYKRPFLMIGKRYDVDIKELLDFGPRWEIWLKEKIKQEGKLYPLPGIDCFVFPRDSWKNIPPFAVGRPRWDNWLVFQARLRKIRVIDATKLANIAHQIHTNNLLHWQDINNSVEVNRNNEIADNCPLFSSLEATHIITHEGIKFDFSKERLKTHFRTLPLLYPQLRQIIRIIKLIYRFIYVGNQKETEQR